MACSLSSTVFNHPMLSTACKAYKLHAFTESRAASTSFSRNFNHLYFALKCAKLPLCRVGGGRFSINCKRTDGDGDSSGEEPPETLFMKELKRRGMTPASLLEENDRNLYALGNKETKTREEGIEVFSNRNDRGTFTGVDDWGQFNQRARSMALNSEGLEGLIPRAKVLLTLGGTFFFAFWPLILTTLAFFSAVYIYFGPTFIHAGNKQVVTTTYIDPYELLEDERITQSSPPRFPYTPSQ